MFSLKEALLHDVACQKRTGSAKQFTLMRGDLIYKGPYTQERLDRLLSRSEQLRKWNIPLIVHPNPEVLMSEVGPFVTYPNLAAGYPVESDPHTESFSNYSYRVLRRNTLVKVSDALKQKGNAWIWDHMEDMLMALIAIYLLDVGDTGLYNMLVDLQKRSLYLIDYDEQRGVDRLGENKELFYFSRHPAKVVADVWIPTARKVYPRVIERLRSLHPYEKETQRIIALFESGQGIEQVTQQVIQLKIIPSHLGKMRYGGLFNGTTTYSGYALDVAKSAVQKYIRRGFVEKAIIAAVEMYRLHEVGGRAAQSNLYNRLASISVEDIGPANLPLVLTTLELVNEDKRDPLELIALVHLMALSEKTRLCSHLWRTYAVPEGRAMAETKGISVDTSLSEGDRVYLESGESMVKWKSTDPIDIRPYAEIFALRLMKRDPNAVTWAYYFLEASKDKKVAPRNRRTQPIAILWEILAGYFPPQLSALLAKYSMQLTEGRPFLMAAITHVLFSKKVYKGERADLKSVVEAWRNSESYSQIMTGQYTFEVDDFVIDKHTAEGSRRGKDRKAFVEEGAHIENRSAEYSHPLYEEIYRTS